eukprot:TRINITY_DN6446_c0_g1_i2.p1 TRINITY_DN6446_c0_g1~~TRINITY_DN6446_c0_g1_i2.p1  ORF type:complete len:165 (-),score=61.03 TRINITY_DN6446_c0_g1_i2:115-609(-)
MKLLSLVLLPLLFCSSLPQCDEGWLEMSSSCYLISPAGHPGGGVDWVLARKACADMGGYLAEITNEEEWAELLAGLDVLYGPEESDHLYIGANDFGAEGVWTWDYSGAAVEYSAWGEGEPASDAWYKDCGIVTKADHETILEQWEWHEAFCSFNSGYICERDLA